MPFDSVIRDFIFGLRSLRRRPLFTSVAVITLGLGIGATTAMFSVVSGVLLQPLPYEDPDDLVSVWHKAPARGMEVLNQTFATYFTYRDENQVFEDIGLWDGARVAVTGLDEPEQVRVILMTHAILPLLRVRPLLGRWFTPDDDAMGAPRTLVLAYRYWQRRFGGDPSVIGRTLTVAALDFEIIGITPPDFRFPGEQPAMLIPFQVDPSMVSGVGGFSFQSIARVRPGVTLAEANADIERMIPRAVERFPNGLTVAQLQEMDFGANVRPLKRDVVGDVGNALWLLFGSVAVVLVIACANVINLFLVRAESQRREIAVRTAIGAGRTQLARQLIVETLTLGLAGGVLGVALAYAGIRFLIALAPAQLPRLEEISLDAPALLFTFGLAVSASALLSIMPLIRFGRLDLVSALKDIARSTSGRERHRARQALVVSQLALALVLLASAGLMVRSVQTLLRVQPGFENPKEALALRISIPSALVSDPEAVAETHERILDRIKTIPGVTGAAVASSVAMDRYDDNNSIHVEEFPVGADELPPSRQVKSVSGDYFETIGNAVVAGRSITWADVHNRTPVAVITANFAREYWPDPSQALGQRIAGRAEGPWYEIVGVVGDVYDDGVGNQPTTIVYWPMVRNDNGRISTPRSQGYVIRSPRVGDASLLEEVRRAVWSVNPSLPIANVYTLDELRRRFMARTSFVSIMLGIAATVAVFLGLVGVYGVISYVVAQRTREIGVRIALGASQQRVSRMVLGQGALLAGLGVTVGLAVSVGVTRFMTAVIHGVRPVDPVTFATVAVLLFGVTLLATYLPARRAARVDPVTALKWE